MASLVPTFSLESSPSRKKHSDCAMLKSRIGTRVGKFFLISSIVGAQ